MEHHHEGFADPRFWVGVAFVVFFLIFGRKIWGVVTGLLDKRAMVIRAELDEAARLRREAEQMLSDAQAQREAAAKQAEEMLVRARAEAERLGEAARHEAEASAQRRERMAMDRIAAAEKAAVNEVRIAAAELAAKAASQVIAESLDAEVDHRLIDLGISGLPAALGQKRAA